MARVMRYFDGSTPHYGATYWVSQGTPKRAVQSPAFMVWRLDRPKGYWRVFFLEEDGFLGRERHTRVLIEGVKNPHSEQPGLPLSARNAAEAKTSAERMLQLFFGLKRGCILLDACSGPFEGDLPRDNAVSGRIPFDLMGELRHGDPSLCERLVESRFTEIFRLPRPV